MATKKDLEREVNRLNSKYSKGKSNELKIGQAYGGYEVRLRAKRYKNGKPYVGSSLGYGEANITHGHLSATKTLSALHQADNRGWIREGFNRRQRKIKK